MSIVSYGEDETNIIMQGAEAIGEVLFGIDLEKKASLLFALDKYLDPYYRYDLPYASDIFLMLEKVIISNDPIEDIKDEAIHL